MEVSRQILFTLSILGGLNALFLSVYFALSSKQNKKAVYFLSALLLVIGIRVSKSVFLFFNPRLSGIFIQIGISACALIGPFLYLYVRTLRNSKSTNWIIHVLPITLVIIVLGVLYPYVEYRRFWAGYIIKSIYFIWMVYIIASGKLLYPTFQTLFKEKKKPENIEIWILSIFSGVFVIWIGYNLGAYTSYIVGALSSSFIFYLILLFWLLRRKNSKSFFEEPIKYASKKIEGTEADQVLRQLEEIITNKQLYKNADLKIADLAKHINITPHYLSQILNDNLGKSFSSYINSYRIDEAKNLLINEHLFTAEAVGYECGFNSKSTFFAVFKKVTGLTPAAYRNNLH